MSKCIEYWCEYHGKNNSKCGRCEKKTNDNQKPELQVILKRRSDMLMELDKKQHKGQQR